jgi:hypothetical protein
MPPMRKWTIVADIELQCGRAAFLLWAVYFWAKCPLLYSMRGAGPDYICLDYCMDSNALLVLLSSVSTSGCLCLGIDMRDNG